MDGGQCGMRLPGCGLRSPFLLAIPQCICKCSAGCSTGLQKSGEPMVGRDDAEDNKVTGFSLLRIEIYRCGHTPRHTNIDWGRARAPAGVSAGNCWPTSSQSSPGSISSTARSASSRCCRSNASAPAPNRVTRITHCTGYLGECYTAHATYMHQRLCWLCVHTHIYLGVASLALVTKSR